MSLEKEKVKRILIVAITRLGDMLQASPTIVGLKREYPNAKITVAIEQNFAAICDGIPGIDEVYPINLGAVCQCLAREKDGIVDAFSMISADIEELRSRDYDFCINMSSSAYTALLLKLVGAKDNRGWVSDDEGYRLIENPWAMLFAAFVYHSNRDYNSLNLVDIFRCSADVQEHPLSLQYHVPEKYAGSGKELISSLNPAGSGPLIAIQAGASQGKRQWAPHKFAKLSEILIRDYDARLIFTGTKTEQPIIDQIFAAYNHPNMVSAVGQTNLAQLGSLLKECALLVTGDTGTMHLNVAVGKPVVALFLASALCFETGPYSAGNLVIQPQVSCNPCNPNLPCSRPDCHDQITPELVAYLVHERVTKSDVELGQLTIPSEVAPAHQAIVYLTEFDPDNFLQFRPLNGIFGRHGFPADYFVAARHAYRALWKREFWRDVRSDSRESHDLGRIPPQVRAGLEQIVALTGEGQRIIERLDAVIKDSTSPPYLLGELAASIRIVDQELERTGLSSNIFGAIVRMFVMEKENLRGDDPLRLALATKELYSSLERRCQLFGRYFAAALESPGIV